MSSDRYSVIFAMNMFCSLGIQTVMQLIIGQSVFDVDIDLRYFIYGVRSRLSSGPSSGLISFCLVVLCRPCPVHIHLCRRRLHSSKK